MYRFVRDQACLWLLSSVMAVMAFSHGLSHGSFLDAVLVRSSHNDDKNSKCRHGWRNHNRPKKQHIPARVIFSPGIAENSSELSFLEPSYVVNDYILLHCITPELMSNLSRHQMRSLLTYLGKTPVKLLWKDQDGKVCSGKNRKHRSKFYDKWDDTNAAAALALSYRAQGKGKLFIEMVVLAPEAILPELVGRGSSLLNAKTTSSILIGMMEGLDEINSARMARAAAYLSKLYIAHWVGEDGELLQHHLMGLLKRVHRRMKRAKDEPTEREIGLVLGSILSGALKRMEEIKDLDEKKVWVINTTSNIVWAATTFIGMAHIAAPVAIAIAGSISMASVMSAAIYSQLGVHHDFTPTIREISGFIEMSVLDHWQGADHELKSKILGMLAFMQSSLHVNGLAD